MKYVYKIPVILIPMYTGYHKKTVVENSETSNIFGHPVLEAHNSYGVIELLMSIYHGVNTHDCSP